MCRLHSAPLLPLLAVIAAAVAAAPARADEAATPAPTGYENGISDYFAHWLDRVNAAQASQPHWMTPLVTVTPRLEEEFRYDQYFEHMGNGANLDVYDAGKGLELIPTETNELLINLPPYQVRSNVKPVSGWNDWPAVTIKQRLLSANEQSGNYIVTAFLGLQVPNGNMAFTNHAYVITPTIAGGKGWGDFDIQATLGFGLPTDHANVIGHTALLNVTAQYHLLTYFWPEFETNITRWFDGERGGLTQVFLTPGLVVGRFSIYGRIRAIIGAGYQFAVSPKLIADPLTPTYNHAWIITSRISF